MKMGNAKTPMLAVLAVLFIGFRTPMAQTKPPESSGKIKKVLLYNKFGGFEVTHGISRTKEIFSKLSTDKGFELIQLETDTLITLDFLKRFQVIVWNNNTNGMASIPSATARQAVLDYLDQGGGWLLIHKAGDHSNTWPGLAETMGTKFNSHSIVEFSEVVMDPDARADEELKWMIDGFPEFFRMKDLFLSFDKTVRPLPGVTVVATTRGIPGVSQAFLPVADGSGDNVYIWARRVGQGRLLYNAIGSGYDTLFEENDGLVARMYWENLRYAAGDYRNGCTTLASPGFDPAARVHVETRCDATGLRPTLRRARPGESTRHNRLGVAAPHGSSSVQFRNLRGARIPERDLPAESRGIISH